ncbi:MAG TPA: hypothetical protein VLI04_10370, partial [Nocardioidaceae bacterium]|nr:hypothetical protein [Nocardioidaceae bacterium]
MGRQHHHGSAEGQAGPVSLALPAVWLAFLALPVSQNWSRRDELEVQIAFAAVIAFATVYLAAFELLRRRRERLL